LSLIGLSSKSKPSITIETNSAADKSTGVAVANNSSPILEKYESTQMNRVELSSDVKSLTSALAALQQSLLLSQSNVHKQQEEMLILQQKHNAEIAQLMQLHREEILNL
jgi:hypothetical protein